MTFLNILALSALSGFATFMLGISTWNIYSLLKWAHSWRRGEA